MKTSHQTALALISFAILVGCTGSQFSAADSTAATSTSGITTTTGTTGTTTTTTDPTATATPSASATPQTCQTGYVDSESYGCIPQNSCPSGQGWYEPQNSCIDLGWAVAGLCEGICPAGTTEMVHGTCLPQIFECPPCTGFDGHQCFWGIHAPEYYHW